MKSLLNIIVVCCLLSTGTATWASENDLQVFDFSLRDFPIISESATADEPDKNTNRASEPYIEIRPADPTWLGDRISFGGDTVNTNGDYRGSLDLAASDITGGNDALSLRYNRFLAGHAEGSNHGFGYSFPSSLGAIIINGNLSDYEDSATGGGRKYQISGDRLLKGWVEATERQSDLRGTASAAEIALQLKSNGLTAGLRVGRMLGDSLSVMQKPDTPDVSLTLSINLK